MSAKKWIALALIVFVVLLLTPLDEAILLAAFAFGGVLAVLVAIALIFLLFLFIFRKTRWGRPIWNRAERKSNALVDRFF